MLIARAQQEQRLIFRNRLTAHDVNDLAILTNSELAVDSSIFVADIHLNSSALFFSSDFARSPDDPITRSIILPTSLRAVAGASLPTRLCWCLPRCGSV